MTRHFGIFEFKPEITPAQIDESFELLSNLKNHISGLLTVEHGPYKSDEGLNEGYTHGFIMTFDSPESRDRYLPHPEHLKVVDIVAPRLTRRVVFDFDVE